jgi:hypothetical protein
VGNRYVAEEDGRALIGHEPTQPGSS